MNPTTCPLCVSRHPKEIWRDSLVYVIDASTEDLPGFIRVILTRHIKEMTDLSESERHHVMRVVFCIESAMRRVMHPEKESTWSLKVRQTPEDVLIARRLDAEALVQQLPKILSKDF